MKLSPLLNLSSLKHEAKLNLLTRNDQLTTSKFNSQTVACACEVAINFLSILQTTEKFLKDT